MARGHGLVALSRDDDADPEHDRHSGFHRNDPGNERAEAEQKCDGEEYSIENRIAAACAERLPTRMSDVDRRRKATAKETGGDGADAVDGHARTGGEAIAGGFGGFDVLQRTDGIDQAHWDDDAEIG